MPEFDNVEEHSRAVRVFSQVSAAATVAIPALLAFAVGGDLVTIAMARTIPIFEEELSVTAGVVNLAVSMLVAAVGALSCVLGWAAVSISRKALDGNRPAARKAFIITLMAALIAVFHNLWNEVLFLGGAIVGYLPLMAYSLVVASTGRWRWGGGTALGERGVKRSILLLGILCAVSPLVLPLLSVRPNVVTADLLITDMPPYASIMLEDRKHRLEWIRASDSRGSKVDRDPRRAGRTWSLPDARDKYLTETVRKDSTPLLAWLRFQFKVDNAGHGDYEPREPRTRYRSNTADESYIYCDCRVGQQSDNWYYIARFGQYIVILQYFAVDIDADRFKDLARAADKRISHVFAESR